MSERWGWVLRYIIVLVLAIILGAALAEMDLFKTTKVGSLTAARIVRFFGFGGALLVFWLFCRRAAGLLPSGDARWNMLKSMLVPGATLVVLAAGQAVLLLILEPFMNRTWHNVYNWVAIAAIIAAAAWLVAALFTGSASLAPLFGGGRKTGNEP